MTSILLSLFKEGYFTIAPTLSISLSFPGIDRQLAEHIAHLFIRDPISVFEEKLHQDNENDTDHFEVCWQQFPLIFMLTHVMILEHYAKEMSNYLSYGTFNQSFFARLQKQKDRQGIEQYLNFWHTFVGRVLW